MSRPLVKTEPNTMLDGLGVARGIAIGPAHVAESGALDVPTHLIEADEVEAELERFHTAIADAGKQIKKLRRKAATLPASASEELGYLLDAHSHMLEGSRLVRGVDQRIGEQRLNAEAAVSQEVSEIALAFSQMEDRYLAERGRDVRDVGQRLLRCLMKSPYQAFADLPEGSVIIADELTPADTALLDPRKIAGFVTLTGGAQDHTAIMARSLGLPAVVGVADLLHQVRPGDWVIVDGGGGQIIVNPDKNTLARYQTRRDELDRQTRKLESLRNVPSITRDHQTIKLQANIDLPGEIAAALSSGAEGIGLFRTEYLFMNRDDLPSEDEQYAQLRNIVEGMEGRPITVRTLDVGNDKLPYSLDEHLAASPNPAMGLRAIRLSLKFQKLLEAQLAAILRAGAHGSVRILLPMISGSSEVRQVRDVMRKVARRLKRRRVAIADPLPPVGAMIEIPGAALAADSLARDCEFFSIGTNDLTMYTLAIDRGDEQVAHLYSPLHPAVLRLIQFSTAAALRARIPINVCGEMAGDERMTALLLGLGIRDLSMTATALPRVKQRIRSLDLSEATRRTQTIMDQADAGMVAVLLDDFNALA
jgi:phosphoenolpyruvate-protein phosphotransferase (PTS system enzyme I)